MNLLTRMELVRHAEKWIAAWNRRDVTDVLANFAGDCVFISPRAEFVVGEAIVEGAENLRRYWNLALEAVPDLHFKLETVICDEAAQVVVAHYVSTIGERSVRACEIMRFVDGRQVFGEAFYGAAAKDGTSR